MPVQVPGIPGVRDMRTLLDFLANQKEYSLHLKRLEDLNAKLEEQIKTVGKAKDISRLLLEAEKKHAQASSILEKAQVDSKAILDQAAKESAATLESANTKANSIIASAELTAEDLKSQSSENRKISELLKKKEEDLEKSSDAAQRWLSEANKIKAEFTAKAEALQGALSSVN